jgi:hypothetical protein
MEGQERIHSLYGVEIPKEYSHDEALALAYVAGVENSRLKLTPEAERLVSTVLSRPTSVPNTSTNSINEKEIKSIVAKYRVTDRINLEEIPRRPTRKSSLNGSTFQGFGHSTDSENQSLSDLSDFNDYEEQQRSAYLRKYSPRKPMRF